MEMLIVETRGPSQAEREFCFNSLLEMQQRLAVELDRQTAESFNSLLEMRRTAPPSAEPSPAGFNSLLEMHIWGVKLALYTTWTFQFSIGDTERYGDWLQPAAAQHSVSILCLRCHPPPAADTTSFTVRAVSILCLRCWVLWGFECVGF